MTNTKKKTIMFLSIAMLLIVFFVVAFIGQSLGVNTEMASAAAANEAEVIQNKLDSVMSNGKAPSTPSNEGYGISNAAQLRDFLINGSGKGYLSADIYDFSWDDGCFTRRLMSPNVTELNGNGYTITLTATKLANTRSTPEISVSDADEPNGTDYAVARTNFADDGCLNTYAGTKETRNNIDLHGGLIGYLRPNQTIKNCNFVYNKTINVSYATRNTGTMGLIVAYSLGTIDNCSLTIGGGITMFADTNWTGSFMVSYQQETMSKHSFALGGYVGTMSNNARLSNSSIKLVGNLALSVQGLNKGSNDYLKNYARAWTGGIVGWMANGSQVYNVVTEGSGNVEARCVNPQDNRTMSFAGIVAGTSGGETQGAGEIWSICGKIASCGRIDGVINKWTGAAKYLVGYNDFSPIGLQDNNQPYLVVGLAGMEGELSNVSNIYMTEDIYKNNTYSIGYDFSVPNKTNGSYRGRWYSTNIFIQDTIDSNGEITNSYTPASSDRAYLKFSGTEISSPVWAVYNFGSNEGILWSKEVINMTNTDDKTTSYYFDLATSINDAKKFNVTYTEIQRKVVPNYTIKYTHGRAVYFKKVYTQGSDTSNPNRVIMPETNYGSSLHAPEIHTFADKGCTKPLQIFYDRSYWYYVNESNNTPKQMTDEQVPVGNYESFIFVKDADGRDCSHIHFLNSALRYVAYIEDDPNYIEFKKTHPDYDPVKGGEKQIDWQQRAVQRVGAKLTGIQWGNADDVTKLSGIKYDHFDRPITFGTYETVYDGDPVTFNLDIVKDDLIGDDRCSATYEYRAFNESTQEYEVVDSCVNAGVYKLVVTGLNNSNYKLTELSEGEDYCIDFTIKQRQIMISDRTGAVLQDDGTAYILQAEYAAADINLADNIAVCLDQSEANASRAGIVFYNILGIDKDILKFEYLPVGGGDLDMRNVGGFDMQISLLTGIKAGNYIMPNVTVYHVNIVETEAIYSNVDDIQFTYGYYIEDVQQPTVRGKGNDGELYFNDQRFYAMNESGEYDDTPLSYSPKNAGKYLIEYDFSFSNYKARTIRVELEITRREVYVEYGNVNRFDTFVYGERRMVSIDATLSRQKVGEDSGILIPEYRSSKPIFKFVRLDEDGMRTDIWSDAVVDAGTYEAELDIDFNYGTVGDGWVVDENTKNNYVVRNSYFTIVVDKKPVSVVLNDVERVYGDDDHKFVGEANNKTNRSWEYLDPKVTFSEDDNIVIMPYLSNPDKFAPVQDSNVAEDQRYKVLAGQSDCSGLVDATTGVKKVDNYEITIIEGTYKVLPRAVKVKVTLNVDNVIYGYDLPEVVSIDVIGDKGFFDEDNISLEALWGGIAVGSDAGVYYVGAKIVASERSSNYKLEDVQEGEFEILPRTITVTNAHINEADKNVEYLFDGTIKTPNVVIDYEEETFNNEVIDFTYNYFEVKDGVEDTVPTEDPTNAGVYRVYLADASSKNYTIVFGKDYVRGSVTMTIKKRDVSIEVYPGYRIYSIPGSLTPIVRGEIHTEEGWHYWTKEEAEANGYGDVLSKPYKYSAGEATQADNMFVQNKEALGAQMYIDEYYSELGVKRGVVKLVFNGLVSDPDAIDADGNWLTEQRVGENGETIEVIMPRYRNYNITMSPGDLHILGASLKDVGQYVNLRNKEEVYDGSDKYEDFRVETTNANIASALKFRVFRYVSMTSLPSAEASALAHAYGKYSQSVGEDGNFVYTKDDEGIYVRKYIKRVEYGDSVDELLTEAGQYFKHITPAKDGIFTDEYITDFYITKAVRDLSDVNVKTAVYYNKIVISCDVEGMIISFNDAGYVNKATFDNLAADTEYTVRIKFTESANYLATEDYIELKLRTGIDISSVADTINKLDKIDFSNITEFENKVLMFIDRISAEDMSLIDIAKFAKLQASYDQLIKGANSVVIGAQKVGAKAVGKSGNSAKTAAAGIALSTGGFGMLFAAGMLISKKKKEEEVCERAVKRVGARRAGKTAVAVIALLMVCVLVFAACDNTVKGFSKYDLYKIASYQEGTNGSRDLTIEVKAGDLTLYKYENGVETKHDKIEAPSISFGSDGMGFEFDDLYFSNAEFKVENGEATFSADIRETLVFLGVENASNGKVKVSVDSEKKSLKFIDVSYDIIQSGIIYSVTINVR